MSDSDRNREAFNLLGQHVNEPLGRLISFMGFDVVEDTAEGCWITDVNGERYLDFLGGFGSLNLGHRHKEVVAAVELQLRRMPLSSKVMLNEPMIHAAKALAEVTPEGLNKVFFVNSGAEAVEGALKLARIKTGRSGIVYTSRAFHGKTLGALSTCGTHKYREPVGHLLPDHVEVPFGDLDALKAAVTEDVAAFIVEPVQGEAGIYDAPEGYLSAAREICHARGALLILDEIQTGFGRTGAFFAAEKHGVSPDIMTLAKSLGGGVMPVGAIVGTDEVWELFEENPLIHSSTFGGNPLAGAAVHAAVQITRREKLWEKAEGAGKKILERLAPLASEYDDLIDAVRGAGLMIGVDFNDEDVGGLIIAGLANRGVIVAYALNCPRVMRIEPPLAVSEEEIDVFFKAFEEALAETRQMIEDLQ